MRGVKKFMSSKVQRKDRKYKNLSGKQKARIADKTYLAYLRFYLEHNRMPDVEDTEIIYKKIFQSVKVLAPMATFEEFEEICEKRVARYENLVFWDDDYLWFFENGFIEGVKHMLAAEGEMFGYGYKYVVELFEDINLKAPMLLIGTESAHQIVNKMAMERYNELMNKMFDGANAAENSWNPDDDNLPFS